MAEYELTLTLDEPVFCGNAPAVSNEMQSLDYIPATSLRGALAGALRLDGRGAEIPSWFSAEGPRWSAAYPVDKEGLACVPAPLVLVQEKRGRAFQGGYSIWNTLHGVPPHTHEGYNKATGETIEAHRFQWTRLEAKWLRIANGAVQGRHRVDMASSMHVGLDYGRQAHKKNALFSRYEIEAGQQFRAYVSDPEGVLQDCPTEIFLGKRRSAGNGQIRVELKTGRPAWSRSGAGSATGRVTVQLMTDAIVRDGGTGGFLRGLDSRAWAEVLGCAVTAKGASATRTVSGWSGEWGLPREQATAVVAGSAYLLEAGAGVAASDFQAAVDRLEQSGLGERVHEGFGWVAIDPPWLVAPTLRPGAEPPRAKEWRSSMPWPDMPASLSGEQKKLLDAAAAVSGAVKGGAARKVDSLAHHAARSRTSAEVVQFLEVMGNRTNPRGWDEVRKLLAGPLGGFRDIAATRFFLTALAAMTAAERGEE